MSHTVVQARRVERALPPSLVVLLARTRGPIHGVFLVVLLARSLGSTLGVSLAVSLGREATDSSVRRSRNGKRSPFHRDST